MTRPISSRQNPRFKSALSLRDRSARDESGLFLIDGLREIRRAHTSGFRIVEAFVTPNLLGDEERDLVDSLAASGTQVFDVPRDLLERLAFGSRCEGLVVVAESRPKRLSDLKLPANPLVAVVAEVEKPGNLGAIFRSADGAGISALVSADSKTDLYNANCIRASLGTVFALPSAVADSSEVIAWLIEAGLNIYATRPDASVCYTAADFREPSAIVLGAESQGLGPVWNDPRVIPVHIPMMGLADSLNVSVSAAVLFYEALRQRS
jgi:TrmH family RNA methyltransferase